MRKILVAVAAVAGVSSMGCASRGRVAKAPAPAPPCDEYVVMNFTRHAHRTVQDHHEVSRSGNIVFASACGHVLTTVRDGYQPVRVETTSSEPSRTEVKVVPQGAKEGPVLALAARVLSSDSVDVTSASADGAYTDQDGEEVLVRACRVRDGFKNPQACPPIE